MQRSKNSLLGKMMKYRLKESEDHDKLVSFLDFSKAHPDAISNIQLKPLLRLVFAPPTLVKNVVDEYCQPTSKKVFSVDTTYNIGPF